jgi:hypothetical protein
MVYTDGTSTPDAHADSIRQISIPAAKQINNDMKQQQELCCCVRIIVLSLVRVGKF